MTKSVKMPTFVARVGPPYPDESLLGFVTRGMAVTAVKQLHRALFLADAAKPKSTCIATTLVDNDEIVRLAHLLGCTPEDIASRTYRAGTFEHSGAPTIEFFGTGISAQFRRFAVRRVSPRALSIAAYHRAMWELPFSFDPATKEPLRGSCPVCESPLGWHRAHGVAFCDTCVDSRGLPNVDLRDFPAPSVEVSDVEALDFVTDLVDPNPERRGLARRLVPDDLEECPNGAIFAAVMDIANGLVSDPPKCSQGGRLFAARFENMTPEVLVLAARGIIGDQKAFDNLCESFRAKMALRVGHYGREKELGPLVLLTRTACPLHPAVKERIRRMTDLNMKGAGPLVRVASDRDGSYMASHSLAARYRFSKKFLHRLATSGLVRVIKAESAKSPVLISVPDVDKSVDGQLRDALRIDQAAALLGLPSHALAGLLERGLVRFIDASVLPLLPSSHFGLSKSSVESLRETLVRNTGSGRDGVSISMALSFVAPGPVPWAAVVAGIVDGGLPVTRRDHRGLSVGRLLVDDCDRFAAAIHRYLVPHEDPAGGSEWIGLPSSADTLRITVPAFRRLILAYPDLIASQGGRYHVPSLSRFAQKYIFVGEISLRLAMPPRAAIAWLRKAHLHPEFSASENRDLAYARQKVEPMFTRTGPGTIETASFQTLGPNLRSDTGTQDDNR